MAIDINEKVVVWGGLSPAEFWGAAALVGVWAAVSIAAARWLGPAVGVGLFAGGAGAGIAAAIRIRSAADGAYLRRVLHEGALGGIPLPVRPGVDVYLPPAPGAGDAAEDDHA